MLIGIARRYFSFVSERVRSLGVNSSDFLWATLSIVATLLLIGFATLDYTRPLALSGDHLFILVHARAMREGVGFWSNPYLGYPFGQHTYLFPQFEAGLKFIVWVIAHLGIGPFMAVKLYYLAGISLITASAYWAMRQFDIQRGIACVLSGIYMLCPYFEVRALGHDYLAIFLTAPYGAALAVIMCTLRTRDDFLQLMKRPFFVVGTLVIATCGLYYAFFSLLFMGAACLISALRIKSSVPIVIFLLLSVFVGTCLIVGGFGLGLGALLKGEIRAPTRSAMEQLYHGLTISDSILGLAGVDFFKSAVEDYNAIRIAKLSGEGGNEWPSIPISLVIITSPLVALAFSANGRKNDSSRIIASSTALIVFGIIFATRGGIGFLLNELVTPVFRGQTRIMPFLTFFAVLNIALVTSKLIANSRTAWKITGIVVLSIVVVGDRWWIGELARDQQMRMSFPDAKAAESSIPNMLYKKNQFGLRSIFQLPIQVWPESSPRNGFEFQNHQLPFVFDKISPPSNWSYGSAAGQAGADEQRAAVDDRNPDRLADVVERMGFDGILIEKAAYVSSELDTLSAGITRASTSACIIFDDQYRTLISLHCAKQ